MERLTDYLRLANQEAKTARAGGNTPFGAILVDDVTGEVLMRQGNAEADTHDATHTLIRAWPAGQPDVFQRKAVEVHAVYNL